MKRLLADLLKLAGFYVVCAVTLGGFVFALYWLCALLSALLERAL